MIKHLLFSAACFLFTNGLHAQTIPNGDFEAWNPGPGYEDPDQWSTLNPFSVTGLPVTVTKSLNAQSGSYAMHLETKATSTDTIPAIAWLGGAGGRGLPYTQRPGTFNAYVQYYPSSNDSAFIFVEFWKNSGSAMIIGTTWMLFTTNVSTYQQFSMPIGWTSSMSPDSVRIVVFASSGYSPKPGSILLLDNISFSGSAGIDDPAGHVSISVFPNPASDAVRFESPETISSIELYDLSGRMVAMHEANGKESMISTEGLTAGIYMYTVKDAGNAVISRGKLNVVR
jgi:hypothetical protein